MPCLRVYYQIEPITLEKTQYGVNRFRMALTEGEYRLKVKSMESTRFQVEYLIGKFEEPQSSKGHGAR